MHVKEYTQASSEMIQSGTDPKHVLLTLRAYLTKRGLLKLYPRILSGVAERVWRFEKMRKPKLILARDSDVKQAKHDLANQMSDETEIRIDEKIIGGYIYRTHGKQTDASYKTKLLNTYYKITKETN